jgi:fluoroquinolone transport system ATP-binding protein
VIEVKGLSYTYPGEGRQVLQELDFAIAKGEILGFLGPSGAGKSTTQKILIGALKGYEGQVRVFGQELKQVNRSYYERIGVAFEFPNFYNRLTALENLSLFRSLYAGKTEEPMALLEAVGLGGHARTKVADYSKGMRMRLNLCRALLNRPEALFLDEPTSGLDPVNAKLLKDIVRAKAEEGVTVILTTHNMTAAQELCDRVAFIVDGRLALIDSPRNLMLRRGSRRVIVEYTANGSRESRDFDMNGIGDNAEFIGLLRRQAVDTLHSQEPSLEQIFIDVTGRGLS